MANKPFSFKQPGAGVRALPKVDEATDSVVAPEVKRTAPAKLKPKKQTANEPQEPRSEKVIIYITKREKNELVAKLDGRSASFKLHQGFKKWLEDL